jgi:hypothetical protein
MICVEIELADDGTFTVGVCPPEEETGEPKDYMQPVKSLDDALGVAQDLLTSPAAQEQEMARNTDEDMAIGFKRARGG